MIELLLARLDENAETRHEEMLARMKAEREADRGQRKTDIEQILAKMEEMFAKMDMKANPGMMQCVGEHQEVSREEAVVMSVGEPKKRRRNRNLAAERRQKPKERTRGYCGTRKRVTIADRKVSRRAAVARRRRDIFAQERTRVKRGPLEQLVAARRGATFRAKMAGRETAKRRTFRKKRQSKQQGKNRVKNLGGGRPRYLGKRDLRKLQLENTGNLNATLTTRREIARRIVGSAVGLQAINIWTLWRGRPPPKRKMGLHTEQEPVM
jgi:hypothetical protein